MEIRDRIVELRRVKASELKANPKNWRKHPKYQREAMQGVLKEVGYAGAALARQSEDGSLELIDGHLRTELASGDDAEIPVLVLDVTEEEAAKILATYDPIGAMAEIDDTQLSLLLKQVTTEDQGLSVLLSSLQDELLEVVVRAEAAGTPTPAPDRDEPEAARPEAGGSMVTTFSAPLTTDQEAIVRDAIKLAKRRFSVTSTGHALTLLCEEWLKANNG